MPCNAQPALQKYRLKEQKRREEQAAAAGGRSSASAGTRGAVPPVAAALRALPNMPTLSPGMVPLNAIGFGELWIGGVQNR